MKIRITKITNLILYVLWCTISFTESLAFAGDRAGLDVIGFSEDGNLFAVLQSGVSDGSGFPYADLLVVDVGKDTLVTGLSEHVILEDDRLDANAAREKLLAAKTSELKRLGFVLPNNQIIGRTNVRNAFDNRFELKLAKDSVLSIELSSFPLGSEIKCEKLSVRTVGLITEFRVNEVSVAASVDKRIPKSRGCPIAYGIDNVFVKPDVAGVINVVVLINYQRLGFEGPDERYMLMTRKIGAFPPAFLDRTIE